MCAWVGEVGAGSVAPGVDARDGLVQVAGLEQLLLLDQLGPRAGPAVRVRLTEDAQLGLPFFRQPRLDRMPELARGGADGVGSARAGMPPGDLQKAKVDAMYLIRERLFGFGDDAEITDENGGPVLQVDGKMLSLRDRLVLRDPDGREVAQVQRRLAAMRPTYQISVAGEQVAKVRKQLFTPFVDRYTIDIPGPDDLEMVGDLFDHEYTVRRGGQVVATASKAFFSIRDTYAVDIARDQDQLLILASVLALDLAEDRERKQR
jgi:uncharacterized protein YxjI